MSTNELTWITLRGKLVSFISSKTKDREIAEDIAHEVYLRVHSKQGQLRDSSLWEPWVFRIARNAVMDHFRNGKKHNHGAGLEEKVESFHTDFNDCVSGCLKDEMKNLPEHYQQALILSEMQSMP